MWRGLLGGRESRVRSGGVRWKWGPLGERARDVEGASGGRGIRSGVEVEWAVELAGVVQDSFERERKRV